MLSSAEVASSNKSTFGFVTIARAISTTDSEPENDSLGISVIFFHRKGFLPPTVHRAPKSALQAFEFLQERRTIMSEIKQNITSELSEEELENVAGGFGRPTMDDPRYKEQMRINTMLKRGMKMDEIQKR